MFVVVIAAIKIHIYCSVDSQAFIPETEPTSHNCIKGICTKALTDIVLNRTHSCCHTALSTISNRIVGNITTHHLILYTIFLPMWGLQILLFGLWNSLVQRQSMECQLCEDNALTC